MHPAAAPASKSPARDRGHQPQLTPAVFRGSTQPWAGSIMRFVALCRNPSLLQEAGRCLGAGTTPSTGNLALAVRLWRWQNTPAFVGWDPILVGGSPGASRGPGLCPTRPINMAVAIASIASARCAVRAAGSTRWGVFVQPAARSAAHTKRSAPALFATTAWRSITGHAAVPSAAKPAERLCFRGSQFTNLYASGTNRYSCSAASVLMYSRVNMGGESVCK